jgi:hypothetical protein
MSARQGRPYDGIARKWLALAEQRRAHLIDILQSGRWRSYVRDEELEDQLYELDLICDRFAEIVGVGSTLEPTSVPRPSLEPPASANMYKPRA